MPRCRQCGHPETDEFKRQLLVEVEANRVRMADIIISHWQTAKRGLNQTNVKIGNQLDEIDKNFLNVQIAVAKYLNSEDKHLPTRPRICQTNSNRLDTARLSAGESGSCQFEGSENHAEQIQRHPQRFDYQHQSRQHRPKNHRRHR